jgi:cation diffusion facilitator CzcD-associated flavoprotein CzcO
MGSVPQSRQTFDVIVIGAGLSGLCSLYHIRQRFPDWRVKVLDSAPDVGGTWYWNCYPGCRFDSESVSYGYSFDKELLQNWHWKETFSPQPETHKYIQYFATKHDMHRDIRFNTVIKAAEWDDATRTWTFTDEEGQLFTSTFFVSCLGVLSAPTLPAIAGISDFKGQLFHTSRWPRDIDISRDFKGKRIGVIGTGATGIQTITSLSEIEGIESISVFQRTANWSAPLRNEKVSLEKMEELRKNYDATFKRCAETPSGFLHMADPRKTKEIPEEERLALYEKLYSEPGFSKWLGVFSDTYTDYEANALYSEFMANKIRERLDDPATAESLIPKDHGFGSRRVPLESGYFEAYNKSHVHLVDLRKTPITQVTSGGIETSDGIIHELDVLICATGFNAITGAFSDIQWKGRGGRALIASSDTPEGKSAIWPDHWPQTYLGIGLPYMPNMFTVLGPHQPFGNIPRSIERAALMVADLLSFCKTNGYTYAEPTQEAVDEWTEYVYKCSDAQVLVNGVDSWLTGVNTNVKGRNVRTVVRYTGSAVEYGRRLDEARKCGFTGFSFA